MCYIKYELVQLMSIAYEKIIVGEKYTDTYWQKGKATYFNLKLGVSYEFGGALRNRVR